MHDGKCSRELHRRVVGAAAALALGLGLAIPSALALEEATALEELSGGGLEPLPMLLRKP